MVVGRPQQEFTAKMRLLRLKYLKHSTDDRNLKEQIVSYIVGAGLASARNKNFQLSTVGSIIAQQ